MKIQSCKMKKKIKNKTKKKCYKYRIVKKKIFFLQLKIEKNLKWDKEKILSWKQMWKYKT